MTPQEIAVGLIALFGANGEHWTKGTLARNANGSPVPVASDEACSWCVNGGWAKLTGIANGMVLSHPSWVDFRRAIMRCANITGVVTWNDSAVTGWDEVERVLDAVAAS